MRSPLAIPPRARLTRLARGLTDGLVRLSVGIEDVDEIVRGYDFSLRDQIADCCGRSVELLVKQDISGYLQTAEHQGDQIAADSSQGLLTVIRLPSPPISSSSKE